MVVVVVMVVMVCVRVCVRACVRACVLAYLCRSFPAALVPVLLTIAVVHRLRLHRGLHLGTTLEQSPCFQKSVCVSSVDCLSLARSEHCRCAERERARKRASERAREKERERERERERCLRC